MGKPACCSPKGWLQYCWGRGNENTLSKSLKKEQERKELKKSREAGVNTKISKSGKGYTRRGKGQEDGEEHASCFRRPLWGCECWFQALPANPHPVSNPPPCERIALISMGPLGRERGKKKDEKKRKKTLRDE